VYYTDINWVINIEVPAKISSQFFCVVKLFLKKKKERKKGFKKKNHLP
jgi:hypothetical protein